MKTEEQREDLQEELLAPSGIQFGVDGLRSFLHFADLNSDVRIRSARFIFGDQTLSTYH